MDNRNAAGIILVFDVTNKKSFLNIQQWIREIEEFSEGSNVSQILVGNKADLVQRREVDHEWASHFAASRGMQYIETSVMGEPEKVLLFCFILVGTFWNFCQNIRDTLIVV